MNIYHDVLSAAITGPGGGRAAGRGVVGRDHKVR